MKKKLKSERGVALAFVIVAFAVVMVLGTVGITAGYANYSKAFGRAESRQAYLTLISAARLLKEELEGAEFTVTETQTVTETAETTERSVTYSPDSGLAAQFLSRLANGLSAQTATIRVEKGDYTQDITWEVRTGTPGEDGTAALTMLLACGGRTVSIEAQLSQTGEQKITEDGVLDIVTCTLTMGAIHEETEK